MQNYIFQAQNAVYQTLANSAISASIVLNRNNIISYPYVIIRGSKKQILPNLQTEVTVDIEINTQDFSVISASHILEMIEDKINRESVAQNINFYTVHHCEVINSTVFANDDGFFCGRLSVAIIID